MRPPESAARGLLLDLHLSSIMVKNTPIDKLFPDSTNPRKADPARLGLLRMSLAKMGFVSPLYATESGMLLSGHQRHRVAKELGIKNVPVVTIKLAEKDIKGINMVFNRATNDLIAFDTGAGMGSRMNIETIIEEADALPVFDSEDWHALNCAERIIPKAALPASAYDKKAVNLAGVLANMGIRIPAVVSESGEVVNGLYRLFAALESGKRRWPIITIPDDIAGVARDFLNYLSMDFSVDEDFARLLRYSAYRRPQNNRGNVPKAYRFWANGGRTLLDKDSYSASYWQNFRDIHGHCLLDFGAGLCKVKPFLEQRGMSCSEFEPYRIDPSLEVGTPSPDFSRFKAKEFLDEVADGRKFNSIFLASVMNSIPFPKDRLIVLAIVHALCDKDTVVYGTCRDMSDFNYEYGGIRNANYFVFDSEPGVRLGDYTRNPKIQKFETQDTADAMFKRFWMKRDYNPGGNVFYFRLGAPMGINPQALGQALDHEFGLLPFADGSTMSLGDHARECFGRRLGIKL